MLIGHTDRVELGRERALLVGVDRAAQRLAGGNARFDHRPDQLRRLGLLVGHPPHVVRSHRRRVSPTIVDRGRVGFDRFLATVERASVVRHSRSAICSSPSQHAQAERDVERHRVGAHVERCLGADGAVRPLDRVGAGPARPGVGWVARRHAERAAVVVGDGGPVQPVVGAAVRVDTVVSRASTSWATRQSTPSDSSALGPEPGANACRESASSTTGSTSSIALTSTPSVSGPGGGQQLGQSVPAIASRSVCPGSSVHVVASSSSAMSIHSSGVIGAGVRPTSPDGSAGQHPT